MTEELKDLVQVIRDNPNCVATIDNDYWALEKVSRFSPDAPNEEDMSYEAYDKWQTENQIAHSDQVKPIGNGDRGPCYGGDILEALAVIVGMKIEGV